MSNAEVAVVNAVGIQQTFLLRTRHEAEDFILVNSTKTIAV